MRALDAGYVHEASAAADQCAPGEDELRDRLPAAFGQSARAIGDALAAFQMLADTRMGLSELKLLERVEIGIGVVEMHDEANRHQPLTEMIEERAAPGLVVERPAHGVLDETGPVLVGRHLPQLLEPDAEFLRRRFCIETELLDQLLAERAARALGDQGVFAAERDARRVAVLVRAVAGDALVAGDYALDRAVRAEDGFRHGDAGIDLDAGLLRLLTEPATEAPKTAYIAAVIAHQRRHENVGDT